MAKSKTVTKKRPAAKARQKVDKWLPLELAAVAVVFVGFLWLTLGSSISDTTRVASFPPQRLDELPETPPEYLTKPPTSGSYLEPEPAPQEHVLSEALRPELQVGLLRRGAVLVHYYCPQGCPELVAQLSELVQDREGAYLMPATEAFALRRRLQADWQERPRAVIALSAYGHLDTLEQFDRRRIDTFIRRFNRWRALARS
ncbi:MAG: DUF3105 domain-containing protein [Deinococcus sp.]|nr:DUF3105 domain-containing protein [Deinococcus sp.]